MLLRLAPHQFIQRTKDDQVTYVYADPLVCDCLYVGTQTAYSSYTRYLQQKQLAEERETTAAFYCDPGSAYVRHSFVSFLPLLHDGFVLSRRGNFAKSVIW